MAGKGRPIGFKLSEESKQKISDKIRDQYLNEQGWTVERYGVNLLRKFINSGRMGG